MRGKFDGFFITKKNKDNFIKGVAQPNGSHLYCWNVGICCIENSLRDNEGEKLIEKTGSCL